MHDSAELIQHLQALLLPHAGVVEAGESRLQRRHNNNNRGQGAGRAPRLRIRTVRGTSDSGLTFVASVRMSLESLTRHCRGTVTSMTFALSCLLLLSVTNLPYQALRMIRPGKQKQAGTVSVNPAGNRRLILRSFDGLRSRYREGEIKQICE